ncbi:hypothetical protein B0H16DRAFT_1711426 [Mycena metata]|uniref:Uncharacterized protein n=1 Tax=Mycena metata TaxID=1033252 RepID=A0AAD7NXK2_9AGAR|nr:hypothetical protein B0H16DRAFT_1711426 [Mycena metata]
MSSFKRPPTHLPHDDNDTDDDDQAIDPELRLRTVRTAYSAIAESIVADAPLLLLPPQPETYISGINSRLFESRRLYVFYSRDESKARHMSN